MKTPDEHGRVFRTGHSVCLYDAEAGQASGEGIQPVAPGHGIELFAGDEGNGPCQVTGVDLPAQQGYFSRVTGQVRISAWLLSCQILTGN